MFEDDYRYEEEDYESDDYKYIEDDEEEDENALWDDTEDISAHDDMGELPKRNKGHERKKQTFPMIIPMPMKQRWQNRRNDRSLWSKISLTGWMPMPKNIPLRMNWR